MNAEISVDAVLTPLLNRLYVRRFRAATCLCIKGGGRHVPATNRTAASQISQI